MCASHDSLHETAAHQDCSVQLSCLVSSASPAAVRSQALLCSHSFWGWPEGPEPAGVFVYPPPYGLAAPCGADWTTPCATLSDGIAQAATSSATQIWVGPGVLPGPGPKRCSHQALLALLRHGRKCQLSSTLCRHTRSQGCTQAWAIIASALWRGLPNDLCRAWPRQCICYLTQ